MPRQPAAAVYGLAAGERQFFNDFEDFADVANWWLANPDLGGSPWRLQEEAGDECDRRYAIFHNQARLGTLEVSPVSYSTETTNVCTHIQLEQLEDVHLLSLCDIWGFFNAIARYTCDPDPGTKEYFEARQTINGTITGVRWRTNPLYKPYKGSGEEINIIGRIRWFAREM